MNYNLFPSRIRITTTPNSKVIDYKEIRTDWTIIVWSSIGSRTMLITDVGCVEAYTLAKEALFDVDEYPWWKFHWLGRNKPQVYAKDGRSNTLDEYCYY